MRYSENFQGLFSCQTQGTKTEESVKEERAVMEWISLLESPIKTSSTLLSMS